MSCLFSTQVNEAAALMEVHIRIYCVIQCLIPGDRPDSYCKYTVQVFLPELNKVYTFAERQPELPD